MHCSIYVDLSSNVMSSHIQPILSRVRQSELDKNFYNSENILCTIVSQDRQLSKIFYTIDKRVSETLDTAFLIARLSPININLQ